MRWMILMATTIFLGACAGPIGPQPAPIVPARPTDMPKKEARPPTVAQINTVQPEATPTSEVVRYRSDLPDLGVAPELNNEVWLNTDQPVRLAEVRGKVVLIDMWTFG
jgi:hypothetical protein